MAQVQVTPKAGDVKEGTECGIATAVYSRVPSLFASPAEAAHPGRLPDIAGYLGMDVLALRP
jgi:hypothetical protein